MAYSTQRAVSDGSLAFVDITIGYLDRSEITVYLNDIVTTAWSWSGTVDKRIVFDNPVPSTFVVLIRRTTDMGQLRHSFGNGAAFRGPVLDEALRQTLQVAQEATESNLATDFYKSLDLHGHQLGNLGPAVGPTDAVPLGQLQTAVAQAAQVALGMNIRSTDTPLASLPVLAARAGKLLGFDANGNPVGLVAATDSAASLALDLLSSAGTTKVFTKVPEAGTASISVLIKFLEFKSITDYLNDDGTRVSPANADNLTGIQRAINQNYGGDLYFPKGNFRISNTLNITNTIRCRGAGRLNTGLICTNTGQVSTVLVTGAQAGVFEDIGFLASSNTGPALRFTTGAHMWNIGRLIFRDQPGAFLQFDTSTWDTFAYDIDALACAKNTTLTPEFGAGLIVKGGCNNIHFKGLRIEVPVNAGVYWANSHGTINLGKVDRGFSVTPTQPGLIFLDGDCEVTGFYVGGNNGVAAVRVLGFSNVVLNGGRLDGGSTTNGLIEVGFTRKHTSTSAENLSFTSSLTGSLHLQGVEFAGRHVSVVGITRGVVTGVSASNILQEDSNVTLSFYNSGSKNTTVRMQGSAPTRNNWCDRAFLVNSDTGYKVKVDVSFSNGDIVVLGRDISANFTGTQQARLEYFADDRDFITFEGCKYLDSIPAFAVLGTATVTDKAYDANARNTNVAVTTGAGFQTFGFMVNARTGRAYHIRGAFTTNLFTRGNVPTEFLVGDALYAMAAGGGYPVEQHGALLEWRDGYTKRAVLGCVLADQGRGHRDVITRADGFVA